MNSVVLLIIFLLVWTGIASYLFYVDRSVKSLKQMLAFREKFEEKAS